MLKGCLPSQPSLPDPKKGPSRLIGTEDPISFGPASAQWTSQGFPQTVSLLPGWQDTQARCPVASLAAALDAVGMPAEEWLEGRFSSLALHICCTLGSARFGNHRGTQGVGPCLQEGQSLAPGPICRANL